MATQNTPPEGCQNPGHEQGRSVDDDSLRDSDVKVDSKLPDQIQAEPGDEPQTQAPAGEALSDHDMDAEAAIQQYENEGLFVEQEESEQLEFEPFEPGPFDTDLYDEPTTSAGNYANTGHQSYDDDIQEIDMRDAPLETIEKWQRHAFEPCEDSPDVQEIIKDEFMGENTVRDVPNFHGTSSSRNNNTRRNYQGVSDDNDRNQSDYGSAAAADDDSDDDAPVRRRRRTRKNKVKGKAIAAEKQPEIVDEPKPAHADEPIAEDRQEMFNKLNGLVLKRSNLVGFSDGPMSPEITYKFNKLNERIAIYEARLGVVDDSDDSDFDVHVEEVSDKPNAAQDQSNDYQSEREPSFPALEDLPVRVSVDDNQSHNSGESTQGKKPRKQPAKSAREYWDRQYEIDNPENGSNSVKRKRPMQVSSASRKTKKQKNGRAGSGGKHKGNKLHEILKYSDPIWARAAQGDIPMPGPIRATTKVNQWAAIQANLANNPNKQVKVDKRILDDASKSFGRGKCKAQDGKWLLEGNGMKTGLYNHQLVGVRWMLGREFFPSGPYGGILADDMGLGKTLEILATMSSNRPDDDDVKEGRVATLIVVPATAIAQWKNEIKEHCSFIRKVWHFKASENKDRVFWEDSDVVICSYQEVTRGYPSTEALQRIAMMKKSDEDDAAWEAEFDEHLGDLFRVPFFRVVLDEAHAIKNRLSRTSQACIALNGTYRWALTATPVQNSVDELYPYLKFLGAEWASDFDDFKKQFADVEDDTVQARLAAVVPSIMLRRRVADQFMGQPILEIPPTTTPEYIWIDLTTEERYIYGRLQGRFQDNLNQHLAEGTAKGKMRTYFSYLTRLRQATAHPFLLEKAMSKNFTLEDINYLRHKLTTMGGKKPAYKQIAQWCETHLKKHPDMADDQFGHGKFGGMFEMDSQLQQMENKKTVDDLICRICYELPEQPQITECGHTFCLECIEGRNDDALAEGREAAECPNCGCSAKQYKPLTDPELAARASRSQSMASRATEQPEQGSKARGKKSEDPRPGNDANETQPIPVQGISRWLRDCDKNPKLPIVPSAKTTAIKDVILRWRIEAPDDKIIVFTQWVELGLILGRMLESEDIGFLYYFSGLPAGKKKKALKVFEKNEELKVLVAGTKCGGQALNLTCANRVILVDQWWNSCVEAQAFGRVHRIGQTKATHFVKILTKNTIDKRLWDMQRTKEAKISSIVNNDPSQAKTMTLEVVKKLFGGEDTELDEAAEAISNHEGGDAGGNGDRNGAQNRSEREVSAEA